MCTHLRIPERLADMRTIDTWLKQPATILLEAGRVLDVKKGTYLRDVAIMIDGDHIREIGPFTELERRCPSGSH